MCPHYRFPCGAPCSGFATTPLNPTYPISLPISPIIAFPIAHTHPNPSPVTVCPGHNNSPSPSSTSASYSSCGARLDPTMRAKVLGKCRARMGRESVRAEVSMQKEAEASAERWSRRARRVLGGMGRVVEAAAAATCAGGGADLYFSGMREGGMEEGQAPVFGAGALELEVDDDDEDAAEALVERGVPLALPVGVELALLAGAMLAGEGSIGGVRDDGDAPAPDAPDPDPDPDPDAGLLSASAQASATSPLYVSTSFVVCASRKYFAWYAELRPWMKPSIMYLPAR